MHALLRPRQAGEAVTACAADERAEFRAGGTDLMERIRAGNGEPATVVDINRVDGLAGVTEEPDALRLGALTTLADLIRHPQVQARAPLLVQALDHTATPQIREAATLGGSLMQRPRCVYYRQAEYHCRKKGGDRCYARLGDNSTHAIFDNDLCCAVHPSTPGLALMALDATVLVRHPAEPQARPMAIQDFFTVDARDASVENALPHGALVEAVRVPHAAGTLRVRYRRASARALADWGDVEVAVALNLEQGRMADARVVLGAVARTPRRAVRTEKHLHGQLVTAALLKEAAEHATHGARPLDFNGSKVELCRRLVLTALEEALA